MRNDQISPRMLIIFAALLLFAAGCSQTDKTETAKKPVAEEPFDSLIVELRGVDSLTVFDILKSSHRVDFATTAAGVFVKGIDSVENGGDFYWIYSVNDSMAQTAADRYVTTQGDIICWHYRRMTP